MRRRKYKQFRSVQACQLRVSRLVSAEPPAPLAAWQRAVLWGRNRLLSRLHRVGQQWEASRFDSPLIRITARPTT